MPRRLIGYDRYSSKAAYAQLGELYRYVRLYGNFFQPVSKLVEKTRDGPKVKKKYAEARTPYQRLLASGVLAGNADGDEHQAERDEFAALFARLKPAKLRRQIDDSLEALWKLTDRQIKERKAEPKPSRGVKAQEQEKETQPAQAAALAVASG